MTQRVPEQVDSSAAPDLAAIVEDMAQQADCFDIGRLGLSSGEACSIDLDVPVDDLRFGGQSYSAAAPPAVRLDVSHTTVGYALRIRFAARLHGPCTRCLDEAGTVVDVDAREIDQPGDAEELRSPYVAAGELDLRSWASDALVLALPARIVCREDCRGLCATCGANLNDDPRHAHDREPDPRWAKLSELRLDG